MDLRELVEKEGIIQVMEELKEIADEKAWDNDLFINVRNHIEECIERIRKLRSANPWEFEK